MNMKKIFVLSLMLLSVAMMRGQVAQILGDWGTVDDKTGKTLSVVQIYQASDGSYAGKIIEVLDGDPNEVCKECTGDEAGKPIKGLVIIRGFKEKDGQLVEGRVLDPNNGKWYYGKIYMKNGNLILRGSLDKAGVLGRSQTWKRR